MENFFQRDITTGKTNWKKVNLEKLRSSDFIGYDSTCRKEDPNGVLLLKNRNRVRREEIIKIGMSDFNERLGELEKIIENNNIDDVKKKQIKLYDEMQRILSQVETSDEDPSIHFEYWGKVITPKIQFGDMNYDIESLRFHRQEGYRIEVGNILSFYDGSRKIRSTKVYNSPVLLVDGYFDGNVKNPDIVQREIEDWRKDHLTEISKKLYGKRLNEVVFSDEKRNINGNF